MGNYEQLERWLEEQAEEEPMIMFSKTAFNAHIRRSLARYAAYRKAKGLKPMNFANHVLIKRMDEWWNKIHQDVWTPEEFEYEAEGILSDIETDLEDAAKFSQMNIEDIAREIAARSIRDYSLVREALQGDSSRRELLRLAQRIKDTVQSSLITNAEEEVSSVVLSFLRDIDSMTPEQFTEFALAADFSTVRRELLERSSQLRKLSNVPTVRRIIIDAVNEVLTEINRRLALKRYVAEKVPKYKLREWERMSESYEESLEAVLERAEWLDKLLEVTGKPSLVARAERENWSIQRIKRVLAAKKGWKTRRQRKAEEAFREMFD